MGLCCSSSNPDEDDEFVHRQTRSTHRPVQQQQQRRQQVQTANHYLAPALPTSTIRAVQASSINRDLAWGAPQSSVRNNQNLLIKPGVTVKIAPKSVTQKITIIEVENCEACGQSDHTKAVCRYRKRLCFYCREEGHIISICPAKKRQRLRKQAQRKRQHTMKHY